MKELGLIGFGAFGQLAAAHLKQFFEISAFDQKDFSAEAKSAGVKFLPLREVAAKEIVVIAVPVSSLEKLLKKIKKFAKPGALFIDVCSVKIKPVNLMLKHLPKNVEIAGTHPLFGPASGANGITRLKIVFCPVRTTREKEIKSFLENKLKLAVLKRTPKQHDREMAFVQGLTHFIARALTEIKIPNSEQKTMAYQHLLDLKELLKDDSFELFLTIEKENPFAAAVRKKFLSKLKGLEKKIAKN